MVSMKEGSKVLKAQPTRGAVPPIIFDGAGNILSFYFDGNPYMVRSENMNFLLIKDLVKEGETLKREGKDEESAQKMQDAINLIDHKKAMQSLTYGRIQVVGKELYYSGVRVDDRLTQLMVKLARQREKFEPLGKFLENLANNVSDRSREQLFVFIERHLFSITPDGKFLAYKVVRSDYTDCHTGTFDNSVGITVEIDRSEVDDNPNRTCSHGLHVCGKSYINSFRRGSNRLLLVEVDPKDVVSVPTDYNGAKMRVCKYRVIEELDDVYENDNVGIVIDTNKKTRRDAKGRFLPAKVYTPLRGEDGKFIPDTNNLNKCLIW